MKIFIHQDEYCSYDDCLFFKTSVHFWIKKTVTAKNRSRSPNILRQIILKLSLQRLMSSFFWNKVVEKDWGLYWTFFLAYLAHLAKRTL
jgi:hypothetical protein